MDFRYNLTNKNKIDCPSCGAKKRFCRYYDNKERTYAPTEYGRCDREISCGYHNVPKNEVIVNEIVKEKPKRPHNIIPYKYYTLSFKRRYQDSFSLFMLKSFGEKSRDSLYKYNVGCSLKFRGNSTVFWQIASDGIRSGKIMQYTLKGKRSKNMNTWVHAEMYNDYELKQVFFGNHLEYKNKKIVIVESEKTAIICDVFFDNDNYVFMSSGMLQGLQRYKFDELKDYKEIICIPDYGKAYDIWCDKIQKLDLPNVRVTKSLQKLNLSEGEDIADIILEKKLEKVWISQI